MTAAIVWITPSSSLTPHAPRIFLPTDGALERKQTISASFHTWFSSAGAAGGIAAKTRSIRSFCTIENGNVLTVLSGRVGGARSFLCNFLIDELVKHSFWYLRGLWAHRTAKESHTRDNA
jgi:hypothetical protein